MVEHRRLCGLVVLVPLKITNRFVGEELGTVPDDERMGIMALVQSLEIVHNQLFQKGFHLRVFEMVGPQQLYDRLVRIRLGLDPKGRPIIRPGNNMTILLLDVDILQHRI